MKCYSQLLIPFLVLPHRAVDQIAFSTSSTPWHRQRHLLLIFITISHEEAVVYRKAFQDRREVGSVSRALPPTSGPGERKDSKPGGVSLKSWDLGNECVNEIPQMGTFPSH